MTEQVGGGDRALTTVMAHVAGVSGEVRATIDALEGPFVLRQADEVQAYLADNPDLLPLLMEASSKIPEFLPPDGPIVLEILWDPEDEDDGGELFAVVPTDLGWEEVRPRMDRLLRDWLIEAGRFTAGRFNVDVEFR